MGSLTNLLKANGIDNPESLTSYSAALDLITVLNGLGALSSGPAD